MAEGTFPNILLRAKELTTIPYCDVVKSKVVARKGIIGEITPTEEPTNNMDAASGSMVG